MRRPPFVPFIAAIVLATAGCSASTEATGLEAAAGASEDHGKGTAEMAENVEKTDAEWRKELTPEQYRVLRQKGTERPFSGEYDDFYEEGTYVCAGCGSPLFTSDTKYDAGCGWPSFTSPFAGENVAEQPDFSHGMARTEVLCNACGGHLGHVFNDGPHPTGLRYCINSVSLQFEPEEDEDQGQQPDKEKESEESDG